MKVLNIVTQLERGGAQTVALDLDKGLNSMGYECETVFIYRKGSISTEISHTVLYDDRIDIFKDPLRILKYIMRSNFDVIITHTHYSNILVNIIGFFAGTRKRIAVQHSLPELYGKVVRFIDILCGRVGIYTDIVMVSDAVRESMRRYPTRYLNRSKVIENGISKPNFRFSGKIEYLCSAGRLSEEKNHKFIIRLLVNIPEVKLIIFGEGHLRQELLDFAASLNVLDRLEIRSTVSQSELHYVMKDSLFLFPSTSEAFGMVVAEAVLMRVPTITSDIPALRNIIGDIKVSLPLIDDLWENKIKNMIESPESGIIPAQSDKKIPDIMETASKYAKLFS